MSYIAYFNAVTQGGASSISPSDVLSSGSVTSSTTHDNGIEGEISPQTSAFRSTIQFRVKSDGWIVAYIDRRLNLAQVTGTQANVIGPWDVLGYGADTGDASAEVKNVNNTELAYVIEHLISQLSNSGSVTYTRGDEALFNYEYASADVTRVLRVEESFADNVYDVDYTFTKTTGTTLAAMWVGSNVADQYGTEDIQVYYEGTQLSSDENGRYGVVDPVSAGTAPGAGETVTLNYQSGGQNDGKFGGWVLTLYS